MTSTVTPTKLLNIDGAGVLNLVGNIVIPSSKYIDVSTSGCSGIKASSSVTVSPTTLTYMDATSSIQTQINTANANISSLTTTVAALPTFSGTNTWNGQNTFTQPINTSSTTLPTFATNSIGYNVDLILNTATAMTSATYVTTSNLTLGVGVWSISGNVIFYSTSANSYSTEFLVGNNSATLYGGTTINYHYNVPANQIIQQSSGAVILRIVGGTDLF